MYFVPLEVKEFLSKYKKHMLREHVVVFKHFHNYQDQFLNSRKIQNKNGAHWDVCLWSHDEVTFGPERWPCPCMRYEKDRIFIQTWMKSYIDVYAKKEDTTSLFMKLKKLSIDIIQTSRANLNRLRGLFGSSESYHRFRFFKH